jgi:lysozyme
VTDVADIIAGQQPYTATNEGCRLKAYRDSMGNWTIGYGHLIPNSEPDWTQEQADHQLYVDLLEAADQLTVHIPWWTNLDAPRAGVLLDMEFNLGPKFMSWHNTLGFAQSGDYEACGKEIMSSEPWASQVGNRSIRNGVQMQTGVYQTEPANA